MATIKEVKREMRYREWAEEIAEYQNSGMKIKEWCRMKGISMNTYYRRNSAYKSIKPLLDGVPVSPTIRFIFGLTFINALNRLV